MRFYKILYSWKNSFNIISAFLICEDLDVMCNCFYFIGRTIKNVSSIGSHEIYPDFLIPETSYRVIESRSLNNT